MLRAAASLRTVSLRSAVSSAAGYVPAKVLMQPLDGVEARRLVEMEIHQDEIGQPHIQCLVARDGLERGRDADIAPPAAEQGGHGVEDRLLVVDAQHPEIERPRRHRGRQAAARGTRACRAGTDRQEHRKARSFSGHAVEFEAEPERSDEALHDGQAEPESAGDPRAGFEPRELGEDERVLRRKDADAGVDHVEPQRSAAPAHADEDVPTGRRILDGIGDKVLHDAADHDAV
jgi:hypothetical protein